MDNFNLVQSEILAELSNADGNLSCCFKRKRSDATDNLDFNFNIKAQVLNSDYLTTMPNCFHSTNSHKHTYTSTLQNDADQKNSICKEKLILTFEDAPTHLKFNPYIRSGYRAYLSTKLCFQSMFWWTNETVNIWSHLVGWLLFLGLTLNDIPIMNSQTMGDKMMAWSLLVCFQLCMFFSFVYHTFSCRSEKDYECFLTYDLLGISVALLAIYTSGIYYAFLCYPRLRLFYSISVAVIFTIAIVMQMPRLNISANMKMIVFVSWAAYGILPTTHWIVLMGGFHDPMVKFLVSRIVGMYTLSIIAFIFYVTRIPERWLSGKVDFVGHSHNWWHLFILWALYYWYTTGHMYLDQRELVVCSNS